MFVGKTGETLWKQPGSLDGRQFMIDKLEECTVHVMDHTNTVSILDLPSRLQSQIARTQPFILVQSRHQSSSEIARTALFMSHALSLDVEILTSKILL